MFPFPDSSLICNHLCGCCQMGHVVYHLTYIVLFAVRSFVFPPSRWEAVFCAFFCVWCVYLSTHMLRFVLLRRISVCPLDRYSDLMWSSFTFSTSFARVTMATLCSSPGSREFISLLSLKIICN